MVEWFKEVFGREPQTGLPQLPPPIDYDLLNGAEITFKESSPRVVNTKMGARAVIIIECAKQEWSLWLSRQGLASQVAALEQAAGDLKGLKVKVEELPRRKRFIPYRLTIL